jgi:hypothetical protein
VGKNSRAGGTTADFGDAQCGNFAVFRDGQAISPAIKTIPQIAGHSIDDSADCQLRDGPAAAVPEWALR